MDNYKCERIYPMQITPTKIPTEKHWQLYLRADPSERLIQKYLQTGFAFEIDDNREPIGVIILTPQSENELEIKNIAVAEGHENQGIATQLLKYARHFAKFHGYETLTIGTGSTSFKQLYLYQKLGFRITEVKKDFFVKNYSEPIYENGLHLQDMILLRQKI